MSRALLPCLLLSALLAPAGIAATQSHPVNPASLGLVPLPASVEPGEGTFTLSARSTVFVAPEFGPVGERQLDRLRVRTGLPLPRVADADAAPITLAAVPGIAAEGYRLQVSAKAVRIEVSTSAGAFYAFQTLGQLLATDPSASDPSLALPAVSIADEPRFPYRGMHLDVGRHFFDVDTVKRYIDTMARFKFNRFHWHLTEDQGWRIEIDAYPRLTEVGAWRAESPVGKNLDPYVGDGVPHGGYYTKSQIREVVAYAAERFVTVIPEIELPGHATAAIAAYPQLGCTAEQLQVSTTWGVHDSVFCPGEETFTFLETVLSEVMELFPSEVVHIGGDEVPKRQWRQNAAAQGLMRREGLTDEAELQSWFIRRIERHLRAHGRRLIGWDEILEGGLAPGAIVMSWRGNEGGIAAARQGHDVIMTPVEHAYFDFYQGDERTEPLAMSWAGFPITLRTAYEFEPVPAELSAAEAGHVLGAQGNLWTEYISTPEYLEYMAYPRALALAEVVWSPAGARNWEGFVARLRAVLPQLDELGVNYRLPDEHRADSASDRGAD